MAVIIFPSNGLLKSHRKFRVAHYSTCLSSRFSRCLFSGTRGSTYYNGTFLSRASRNKRAWWEERRVAPVIYHAAIYSTALLPFYCPRAALYSTNSGVWIFCDRWWWYIAEESLFLDVNFIKMAGIVCWFIAWFNYCTLLRAFRLSTH